MRLTSVALLVLLALDTLSAHAQTGNPPPTRQVHINGSKTDVEAGRDFVAGKIVIGKERIAASGVPTTGELLRREPAISVGKNGSIGLLGMSGYTQILVDGAAYTGDPLQLDLVHVDRIEIIKTTTAATGPFGIAGTINIVRKGAQRQVLTTLRGGASVSGGRVGGDLAWSSNQVAANAPFVYNLRLSARYLPSRSERDTVATLLAPGSAPAPYYTGQRAGRSALRMLNGGAELSWTPAPGHKLSFSPDLGSFTESSAGSELRRWLDGRSLSLDQTSRARLSSAGLPLRWNWSIDADSRLALRVQANFSRMDPAASTREIRSGAPLRTRLSDGKTDMRGQFLDLDYNTVFGKHEIAAGAKLIRNRRDTDYLDLVDGVQDPSLAVLGLASASRVERRQLFAQDDWRIDPTLSVNAGASAEWNSYRLREGAASTRQSFTLWSPSAHIAKKIGGDAKRQLRFSLARSFKAPDVDQMLLHPRINAFAPCPPDALCGANGIETADASGNPQLRPERALGLNLSYAHGFGKGSEVRLEGYARRIGNKIGSDLALENVAWANAPRWVVRPANLGQARVAGVDLEGRLSAKDLGDAIAARWPMLEVRGSIGWADSRLDGLPGPDNRLADSSPWRAKLGGSYSLKAWPLKLGLESNYLPGDWVRSSLRERVFQSHRFTLGANAAWQLDPKSRVTLNLDNVLHRTNLRIEEYTGSAGLLRETGRSADYARVALRFETRL